MRAQQKRSLWIGVPVLLCLLALLGFGAWFWSLGSFAPDQEPSIQMSLVQGGVDVKRPGDANWHPATQGESLVKGEQIRTGKESRAELNWGDRGVTRLDAETEMTVDDMPFEGAVQHAVTSLRLSTGRLWSRVLKLLDVDSGFRVQTDGVVATVRGTTFGVTRKDSVTEAFVAESVVSVGANESVSPMFLADKKFGSFSATGTVLALRDVDAYDAWVSDNSPRDAAFDESLRSKASQRFAADRVAGPEWLIEASERLHLRFAQDADAARTAYARRLVAAAVQDPSNAAAHLSKIAVHDLNDVSKDAVLRDIRLALLLQTPRPGFTPDARLVRDLETERAALLGGSPYSVALTLDDRIDAFLNPPAPLSDEDALRAVTALRNDISAWRDANSASPELVLKAQAMLARLPVGTGAAAELPPAQDVTATTTPAIAPVAPGTTPRKTTGSAPAPAPTQTQTPTQNGTPVGIAPQPASVCDIASVTLVARPTAVIVGDSVYLTLYGFCVDGSRVDLSSNAVFSSGSPNDGSVNANVFVPASAGTPTLYGAYQTPSGTKVASTKITVRPAPRVLSGVTVSVIGSTALTTGQRAMLDATANYSDGTTADIAYQCAWSTSDPQLALISGLTFQTLSGIGTVQAICTYTENGVQKSGSVVFSISLDPSLTPTITSGGTRRLPTTFVP